MRPMLASAGGWAWPRIDWSMCSFGKGWSHRFQRTCV